jgi:SLT domain-containing protein
MSGPDYSNYQQTCSQINETTIQIFKQQREVIGIIENVNKTFGDLYLQNIQKYSIHTQIDWNLVKQFNDIGSPKMESFEINNQQIQLSPTTL